VSGLAGGRAGVRCRSELLIVRDKPKVSRRKPLRSHTPPEKPRFRETAPPRNGAEPRGSSDESGAQKKMIAGTGTRRYAAQWFHGAADAQRRSIVGGRNHRDLRGSGTVGAAQGGTTGCAGPRFSTERHLVSEPSGLQPEVHGSDNFVVGPLQPFSARRGAAAQRPRQARARPKTRSPAGTGGARARPTCLQFPLLFHAAAAQSRQRRILICSEPLPLDDLRPNHFIRRGSKNCGLKGKFRQNKYALFESWVVRRIHMSPPKGAHAGRVSFPQRPTPIYQAGKADSVPLERQFRRRHYRHCRIRSRVALRGGLVTEDRRPGVGGPCYETRRRSLKPQEPTRKRGSQRSPDGGDVSRGLVGAHRQPHPRVEARVTKLIGYSETWSGAPDHGPTRAAEVWARRLRQAAKGQPSMTRTSSKSSGSTTASKLSELQIGASAPTHIAHHAGQIARYLGRGPDFCVRASFARGDRRLLRQAATIRRCIYAAREGHPESGRKERPCRRCSTAFLGKMARDRADARSTQPKLPLVDPAELRGRDPQRACAVDSAKLATNRRLSTVRA